MMMPAWLTIAGNCAAAWETRFCTSTAAISIGYPTLNVTVMFELPSLALTEDM
jgi:hypothetical protein